MDNEETMANGPLIYELEQMVKSLKAANTQITKMSRPNDEDNQEINLIHLSVIRALNGTNSLLARLRKR